MLTLQKGHLLVMYTNRCDASSLFSKLSVSVELRSSCSQITGVTLICCWQTVSSRRRVDAPWQPCQSIPLNTYTDGTVLTECISVRLIVVFSGTDFVKNLYNTQNFLNIVTNWRLCKSTFCSAKGQQVINNSSRTTEWKMRCCHLANDSPISFDLVT